MGGGSSTYTVPETKMATDIDQNRFIRVLADSGYHVGSLTIEPLKGGISASMWRLDVEPGNLRLVARRPGLWRTSENEHAARHEFETLGLLTRARLPVPAPIALETDASIDPAERFFVMEFVNGLADLNPSDVESYVSSYAELLVQIHETDLTRDGLGQIRRLRNPWTPRGESLDETLLETDIRAALESGGPQVSSNTEVLRHADLWPGNVLWRDGKVLAAVDWENVCIGEPLADVSICRLDLLWVLGWDAMGRFTRLYLEKRPVDPRLLAYHDLVASLRPCGYLSEFASAYPEFGRPDITVETLTTDHRRFVEDALRRFKNENSLAT